MKKTYCVLGGGGSFGLHTSKYLLDHADPAKVIAVGRNLPKYECFTLGIGDGDPRYSYHAYHVNYELDLLMELLGVLDAEVLQEIRGQFGHAHLFDVLDIQGRLDGLRYRGGRNTSRLAQQPAELAQPLPAAPDKAGRRGQGFKLSYSRSIEKRKFERFR